MHWRLVRSIKGCVEDGTYENFEFKGLDLVGNGSKYSAENIKEIGSETELAFTVESMIIKIVSRKC